MTLLTNLSKALEQCLLQLLLPYYFHRLLLPSQDTGMDFQVLIHWCFQEPVLLGWTFAWRLGLGFLRQNSLLAIDLFKSFSRYADDILAPCYAGNHTCCLDASPIGIVNELCALNLFPNGESLWHRYGASKTIWCTLIATGWLHTNTESWIDAAEIANTYWAEMCKS